MPEFKIIKNALCLTFDSLNRIGNYTIIVKSNRIFDIEYNTDNTDDKTLLRKYPNATIINAENKILVPSFLNACKNSSYIFSGIFFRDIKYDDINTNVSLRLIDNYFLKGDNSEDLLNLFKISYLMSLINGECLVNENSKYINTDLILSDSLNSIKIKPNIILTVYDNYISDYILGINRFHCIGLREDEDLNNYTINSIKSTLSRGNKRAIIEAYQSANSSDTLRSLFGKSFIKVLLESDLLSGKVIFSNPVYLTPEELAIIIDKNSNILIQPTDWIILSKKINELERFFSQRNSLSLLIGTGYLGKSVFSQVKLLYSIFSRAVISAESLLRLITIRPATFFNISNISGSIEKNKLANFVLFDISDLRNILNIPEINTEFISEFILENLSEKDISDIYFHGIPIIENYRSNVINYEEIYEIYNSLMKKIYQVGRYFDFKEKILMTERVKNLSIGIVERKETIPETVKQENSAITIENEESEFKIKGTFKSGILNGKEGSFYDEESLIDDAKLTIKELIDLNKGFDFLDLIVEEKYKYPDKSVSENETQTQTEGESKISFKKKIYFDDLEYSRDNEEEDKSSKSLKSSLLSYLKKPKDKEEKVKFKKGKLRFGFDDE